MLSKIKRRVYQILERAAPGDVVSRVIDIFLISLILLNILAVILETVPGIHDRHWAFFRYFEEFSVLAFTVEYLLRVWTCTEEIKFNAPVKGRIRYVFSMLAVLDLIAILPFYLPMVFPFDLRIARALRLFRIFRLFKLTRYSNSMNILIHVLRDKKEDMVLTAMMILVLLLFSSGFIYYVEHPAQPEAFASIPHALWWGVATLTTVGYGDIYPVTGVGKLIGGGIMLLGIGLFALPAGILASGFSEEIKRRRRKDFRCPHCGKTIG